MTKHTIIAWKCKTENCGQLHAAKYLGEKDKIQAARIPIKKFHHVTIECPKCGQSHDYFPQEIRYVELDAPPPPQFRDLL